MACKRSALTLAVVAEMPFSKPLGVSVSPAPVPNRTASTCAATDSASTRRSSASMLGVEYLVISAVNVVINPILCGDNVGVPSKANCRTGNGAPCPTKEASSPLAKIVGMTMVLVPPNSRLMQALSTCAPADCGANWARNVGVSCGGELCGPVTRCSGRRRGCVLNDELKGFLLVGPAPADNLSDRGAVGNSESLRGDGA